ncbi:SpvB/TcaC N-terminal domain-containing protein, partial [Polaromonas sp. YR568]|uniref:SpvB/TcaC N-terminal domain-containing protein n=1 Tax=Polaromonas sp. YR568 TaxID=1855301 RepID=UPI001C314C2A
MQEHYRKAVLGIALCWLGAAAAIPAMAQTNTVAGVTPGQFSVNESGAATYRIPIEVPPGVAGMEPKLELAYNSQGGNGLLGMGWNLSGLSTISRCPRTMAIDSFRGALKFDMNDRYCMDGQRLILVSGTYGVAGSEYRTELDSFSRITASGTAGNGVASFTVQTKAGLTMEYGNTADSRIEAQGKATVRVWALNKISDVKTNYLTVSYYKSADSSVYAPLTVGYDGNVVNIEYETTRPDRIQGYMAGSLVQVDRRISHIKTHAKGSSDVVFDYRISYTGGATVQRSVIANISRCERNGNCLPGLALAIGNTATVGFTSSSTHLANLSDSAFVHGVGDAGLRVVDLNGDGLPDLLHLGYFVNGEFGGGLIRRAFINTGTGFVRNDAYVSGVSDSAFTHTYSRDGGLRVVDLNGDGLPDLLHLGYFVNGEWG